MIPPKLFPDPRATITELVDACHAGDGERLRCVFSKGALMSGYFKGEYYSGSPEPFFDEVRDNPAPASTGVEYIAEITSIEEFGDIANAILEEKNFLGADFMNLYQLASIDGNWLIVSKAYVDEW
jgi:hypothetical protein